MKVYKISGNKAIILFIIIILFLLILFLLALPIIIFLFILILGYIFFKYKFKGFLKHIYYRLRRKKIKIIDNSNNGEIKINFRKSLENVDDDTKMFINYLKNIGAKVDKRYVYINGYKAYPIYKSSYPVNEIITLNYPEDVEAVILGLKGSPDNPKFLFLIPKEFLKRRMHIDEIKRFILNI